MVICNVLISSLTTSALLLCYCTCEPFPRALFYETTMHFTCSSVGFAITKKQWTNVSSNITSISLLYRNQNVFTKCVCGATVPQIGSRLPRIKRFLPKKRKASSEEHWVCTHISFQNAVQLCLRIFQSCICVFQSCVCNRKTAQ